MQCESEVKAVQGPKRAASALRRVGVHGWVSLVCATAGLFGGTGVSEGIGLKSSAQRLQVSMALKLWALGLQSRFGKRIIELKLTRSCI